jgi:hypothetical protein
MADDGCDTICYQQYIFWSVLALSFLMCITRIGSLIRPILDEWRTPAHLIVPVDHGMDFPQTDTDGSFAPTAGLKPTAEIVRSAGLAGRSDLTTVTTGKRWGKLKSAVNTAVQSSPPANAIRRISSVRNLRKTSAEMVKHGGSGIRKAPYSADLHVELFSRKLVSLGEVVIPNSVLLGSALADKTLKLVPSKSSNYHISGQITLTWHVIHSIQVQFHSALKPNDIKHYHRPYLIMHFKKDNSHDRIMVHRSQIGRSNMGREQSKVSTIWQEQSKKIDLPPTITLDTKLTLTLWATGAGKQEQAIGEAVLTGEEIINAISGEKLTKNFGEQEGSGSVTFTLALTKVLEVTLKEVREVGEVREVDEVDEVEEMEDPTRVTTAHKLESDLDDPYAIVSMAGHRIGSTGHAERQTGKNDEALVPAVSRFQQGTATVRAQLVDGAIISPEEGTTRRISNTFSAIASHSARHIA